MTSVDTMVIPLGGDVYTRLDVHELLLRPGDHGPGRGRGDYIPPVKGVKEAIAEIDPALAEDPLIFPPPEVRELLYEYEPAALENPEFQEKWQAVIGA